MVVMLDGLSLMPELHSTHRWEFIKIMECGLNLGTKQLCLWVSVWQVYYGLTILVEDVYLYFFDSPRTH